MHILLLLAALGGAGRGTVGAGFMQLFDPQSADHRGMLVVLAVEKGSPAEKAGLRVGDLVTSVDGAPVRGRALEDISRRDLHGPAGGSLKLGLFRLSTQEQSEVTVARVAYQPIETAPSDAFHYVTPGAWHTERHDFPLQWAPSLPYRGLLDLRFAPDFNDPASPDYSSYFFVWWLDGAQQPDARRIEQDLVTYYRGLNASMAQLNGTKPGAGQESASFAGGPDLFRGMVTSFDPQGKVEPRHGEVKVVRCGSHTALLFSVSPQERAAPIWSDLDAIRDSFRCRT